MADSSSLGTVARKRLLPVADKVQNIEKGSLSIACIMKCWDEMIFVAAPAAENTWAFQYIFQISETPIQEHKPGYI